MQIDKLFRRLKRYWYLYDIDNGTIHEKIFDVLYIEEMSIDYEEVAARFFIGDRTLDRYISRYNIFAWKLIKSEYSKNNVIYKLSSEVIEDPHDKSAKKWR